VKPLKILVVDDSRSSRMMVKTCINESAIPVASIEEADSGETAVAKFKAGSFDLILMDIHMPKVDGYQAAQMIRVAESKAHRPRTPMIALTAMNQQQAVEKTRAAGFTKCLGKPIKRAEFVEAIQATTSCGPITAAAPAAPPPKPSGGLFRKLLGGSNDAYAGLEHASLRDQRSLFIAEKRRDVEEALAALDQSDFATVVLLAHRLKGEGANFGFGKVSEYGGGLAAAAEAKDEKGARAAAHKLAQYLASQSAPENSPLGEVVNG
jgi:CheY-like chemotaxis protein/HPt (histidine-containing phosphotransfer) domain-containing protein